MIAALGLVLGVFLGLLLQPEVPVWLQPYLPIAVVAALDAVFGALRAFLDGIFDDKVFVVSFVSNVLIAALIVYLGDQLGVGGQLSTGVIVVLGIRIFSNVAAFTSLPMRLTDSCATVASACARKPADTYAASWASQRRQKTGSSAADFSV